MKQLQLSSVGPLLPNMWAPITREFKRNEHVASSCHARSGLSLCPAFSLYLFSFFFLLLFISIFFFSFFCYCFLSLSLFFSILLSLSFFFLSFFLSLSVVSFDQRVPRLFYPVHLVRFASTYSFVNQYSENAVDWLTLIEGSRNGDSSESISISNSSEHNSINGSSVCLLLSNQFVKNYGDWLTCIQGL